MKKLIIPAVFMALIGTLLAWPTNAEATCYKHNYQQYYNQTYQQQYDYTPAVIAAPTIDVPAFRFFYDPSPPYRNDIEELRKVVREELQAVPQYTPAPTLSRRKVEEIDDHLVDDGLPPAKNAPLLISRAGDIETAAINILSTSCARCHTGAGASGNFIMFDRPGILSSTLDRQLIKDAALPVGSHGPKMPPKDPKLSKEQQNILADWVSLYPPKGR
jgi:hypothetical protein